uniref:Uncharacterized protein n=1 Tax=Zonotrichia albicollis TaxID=44394 RepID=A0A8D2QJM9_ZONAL
HFLVLLSALGRTQGHPWKGGRTQGCPWGWGRTQGCPWEGGRTQGCPWGWGRTQGCPWKGGRTQGCPWEGEDSAKKPVDGPKCQNTNPRIPDWFGLEGTLNPSHSNPLPAQPGLGHCQGSGAATACPPSQGRILPISHPCLPSGSGSHSLCPVPPSLVSSPSAALLEPL